MEDKEEEGSEVVEYLGEKIPPQAHVGREVIRSLERSRVSAEWSAGKHGFRTSKYPYVLSIHSRTAPPC